MDHSELIHLPTLDAAVSLLHTSDDPHEDGLCPDCIVYFVSQLGDAIKAIQDAEGITESSEAIFLAGIQLGARAARLKADPAHGLVAHGLKRASRDPNGFSVRRSSLGRLLSDDPESN